MKATEQAIPRRIALEDAELYLYENLDILEENLMPEIVAETDWSREFVTLFGKTHPQPRLVAYYGDTGACYTYSGKQHQPLPWTRRLLDLRQNVEQLCNHSFNSVLLNYYRNEEDSMGLHADDEPELGEQPVIASLTLGEERNLFFQARHSQDRKNLILPLPSSSLLIMQGDTQRHWKHGMRKLRRPCGPRLNLTFRSIVHPAQISRSPDSAGTQL